MATPSLSVAVLVYNEEETLEAAVRHVHEALLEEELDFEVVIVDDGSEDTSAEIAARLADTLEGVRLVQHGRNRGPGSGIRTGIEECTKEVFTFFAADLQGNFVERLPHLARLVGDADILVGQRSGASNPGPWRRLNSLVFVGAMQTLFGVPFGDFNFFYFFTKEVLAAVEPRSRSAFICPEIMVRALEMGFRVVPVMGRVHPRRAGRATVGRAGPVARFVGEMTSLWAERKAARALSFARSVL